MDNFDPKRRKISSQQMDPRLLYQQQGYQNPSGQMTNMNHQMQQPNQTQQISHAFQQTQQIMQIPQQIIPQISGQQMTSNFMSNPYQTGMIQAQQMQPSMYIPQTQSQMSQSQNPASNAIIICNVFYIDEVYILHHFYQCGFTKVLLYREDINKFNYTIKFSSRSECASFIKSYSINNVIKMYNQFYPFTYRSNTHDIDERSNMVMIKFFLKRISRKHEKYFRITTANLYKELLMKDVKGIAIIVVFTTTKKRDNYLNAFIKFNCATSRNLFVKLCSESFVYDKRVKMVIRSENLKKKFLNITFGSFETKRDLERDFLNHPMLKKEYDQLKYIFASDFNSRLNPNSQWKDSQFRFSRDRFNNDHDHDHHHDRKRDFDGDLDRGRKKKKIRFFKDSVVVLQNFNGKENDVERTLNNMNFAHVIIVPVPKKNDSFYVYFYTPHEAKTFLKKTNGELYFHDVKCICKMTEESFLEETDLVCHIKYFIDKRNYKSDSKVTANGVYCELQKLNVKGIVRIVIYYHHGVKSGFIMFNCKSNVLKAVEKMNRQNIFNGLVFLEVRYGNVGKSSLDIGDDFSELERDFYANPLQDNEVSSTLNERSLEYKRRNNIKKTFGNIVAVKDANFTDLELLNFVKNAGYEYIHVVRDIDVNSDYFISFLSSKEALEFTSKYKRIEINNKSCKSCVLLTPGTRNYNGIENSRDLIAYVVFRFSNQIHNQRNKKDIMNDIVCPLNIYDELKRHNLHGLFRVVILRQKFPSAFVMFECSTQRKEFEKKLNNNQMFDGDVMSVQIKKPRKQILGVNGRKPLHDERDFHVNPIISKNKTQKKIILNNKNNNENKNIKKKKKNLIIMEHNIKKDQINMDPRLMNIQENKQLDLDPQLTSMNIPLNSTTKTSIACDPDNPFVRLGIEEIKTHQKNVFEMEDKSENENEIQSNELHLNEEDLQLNLNDEILLANLNNINPHRNINIKPTKINNINHINMTVFIKLLNLPLSLTCNDIYALMKIYGRIMKIQILQSGVGDDVKERKCYVEYENFDGVESALHYLKNGICIGKSKKKIEVIKSNGKLLNDEKEINIKDYSNEIYEQEKYINEMNYPTSILKVRNIGKDVTLIELSKIFSFCGECKSINFIENENKNDSNDDGKTILVVMENLTDSIATVMFLKDIMFGEKKLIVTFVSDNRKRKREELEEDKK